MLAHRRRVVLCQVTLAATIVLTGWVASAVAQNPVLTQPLPSPAMVQMNLQGEVQLEVLIGYIAQRLGIQFQYDPSIGSRSVSIRTPDQIPVASLPTLLGNVLRTQGLALIDTDREGWKRIVEVRDMTSLAQIRRGAPPRPTETDLRPAGELNPATPITQVFQLENLSADSVATVLKPFLSSESASLTPVKDSNTLIVTDYAATIQTLADLIALVDQPAGRAGFVIYEAKYQSGETLVEQVKSLLGLEANEDSPSGAVQLLPQPLGNRIIVAGTTAAVTQAESMLKRLDIQLGVTTQVYRIRNTTSERIDRLIKGFVEPPNNSESAYQTTVDEEGNLLIVRASQEVHRQIADLIERLDTAVESDESPIQFYKLKNASAIDVLYSLLALQEAVGVGGLTGVAPAGFYSPFGGIGGVTPIGVGGGLLSGGLLPGGALGGNVPIQLPLAPNSGARTSLVPPRSNPLARPTLAGGVAEVPGGATQVGAATAAQGALAQGFGGGLGGGIGGGLGGGVATLPGGARVSADVSTNSLIVYAPASVQPMYAELIKSLDQRRPQVLIEAKIIAVRTTDDYTLGVEISAGDREGAKRLFKFSSFGLSEVNPDTGALRIIPGLGFNGTLIDPEVADVVVRALATHERSRVLAAPKILVNDNSTGTLESVVSVPFASVNASNAVATTSLGGDQQAGTIITVTPHINEDDHLQLEFDVEFSSFSGSGADGLPPPRAIDRVGSSVTIPSGSTVVVGGLKRLGIDNNFSGIPWAERIPIIRELTSRTDDNYATTSFFLFIRPVVLRDSRFADLQYLSQGEAEEACIPGDYPSSRPELIP